MASRGLGAPHAGHAGGCGDSRGRPWALACALEAALAVGRRPRGGRLRAPGGGDAMAHSLLSRGAVPAPRALRASGALGARHHHHGAAASLPRARRVGDGKAARIPGRPLRAVGLSASARARRARGVGARALREPPRAGPDPLRPPHPVPVVRAALPLRGGDSRLRPPGVETAGAVAEAGTDRRHDGEPGALVAHRQQFLDRALLAQARAPASLGGDGAGAGQRRGVGP